SSSQGPSQQQASSQQSTSWRRASSQRSPSPTTSRLQPSSLPASWPACQPCRLRPSSRQPSFHLLDGDQVVDRLDHPANLGTVFFHDDVADALETERPQGLAVLGLHADRRPLLLNLEASHH